VPKICYLLPATKKAAKPKKEKKVAVAPKAKKTGRAAAAAPAHPKYSLMISAAIGALKDRTGSSRQAILKYITANYTVDPKKAAVQLRLSLKRGVTEGSLKMAKEKGKGAGCFKLADKAKKSVAEKKPATPKKEKPKAKKTIKKATPKKPAAAKKPAKKAVAAKKAAKKGKK